MSVGINLEKSKSPEVEPRARNGVKILVFSTAFKPLIGGSEIALEEIIKRLPDIFFDIVTPKFKKDLDRFESFDNNSIYRVGWGCTCDKLFFPVIGFFKALKLYKKNTYQIIHAYQASYGGGVAWLFKIFKTKAIFILTLQEGKNLDKQSFFIRFFRNLIIKKADIITVISNYLKSYAEQINEKATIVLIPNGVDAKKFNESINENNENKLREELRIKKDEKIIITISRLVPKNGVTDLINAFYKLNPTDRNLKLLIVGSGYMKESLESEIKNLGIEKRVIMLGNIPHENIVTYLKISDLFVRPSLSEGLGSAFLEAMAAGLPIIGTKVGGIADFLIDGETGLFCETNNPDDLAEKINRILDDGELRKKLAENGLKLALEKYNWDKIADKFRELYKNGM